jgi:hypothetical protein
MRSETFNKKMFRCVRCIAAVFCGTALVLLGGGCASLIVLAKSPGPSFEGNFTELHLAVRGRDLQEAATLLEGGADINATTTYHKTPLFFAVADEDIEMVNYLLKRGARIADSMINTPDAGFVPLLHFAILRSSPKVAIALVENGGNVRVTLQNGQTTLESALHRRQLIQSNWRVSAAKSSKLLAENTELIRILLGAGVRLSKSEGIVDRRAVRRSMFIEDEQVIELFNEYGI